MGKDRDAKTCFWHPPFDIRTGSMAQVSTPTVCQEIVNQSRYITDAHTTIQVTIGSLQIATTGEHPSHSQ